MFENHLITKQYSVSLKNMKFSVINTMIKICMKRLFEKNVFLPHK